MVGNVWGKSGANPAQFRYGVSSLMEDKSECPPVFITRFPSRVKGVMVTDRLANTGKPCFRTNHHPHKDGFFVPPSPSLMHS